MIIQRYTTLFCLVLLLTGLGFFAPSAPVLAQSGEWLEYPTTHFTILYTPGEEATAEAYAGFVDSIYDEISVTFEHRTETPLLLRLYPTFDSYYEVNPVARDMPGIVAHADFRRRELAVVLPQTEQQTPDEIQNNIRHELTHIIAADLSNNQLNTGWQEGIAQYMEIPTPETDRKLALLSQSVGNNDLIAWSDFEDRDSIYGQPERGYPQSLSATTFLIENYGFERFRTFMVGHGESSGYRAALENSYGISATELEEQWLAWLPSYVDGSYREQPVVSYDLSYPRDLLAAGRYAEAETEIQGALEWLRGSPQEEALAEAEALLARSRDGQEAERLANESRAALEAANYEQAAVLVEQARSAYAAIGDTRQEQVLAVYVARIERGLRARQNLDSALQLSDDMQLLAARDRAQNAATDFAALGDQQRLEEALAISETINTFQWMGGLVLVALGSFGLVVGLISAWFGRRAEVW